MNLKYLALLMMILFCSCKNGSNDHTEETNPYKVSYVTNEGYQKLSPEALFTPKELESLMELNEGTVYEIVGGNKSTGNAESARYRITDPEKGNAAIIVGWINDPKIEGYPDWAQLYVYNKIASGVTNLKEDQDLPHKFKRVNVGQGIDAAFNANQASIVWHYPGQDWVGRILFNITKSDEDLERVAIKLVKSINTKVTL